MSKKQKLMEKLVDAAFLHQQIIMQHYQGDRGRWVLTMNIDGKAVASFYTQRDPIGGYRWQMTPEGALQFVEKAWRHKK